jgi:hypothetical protein
METTKSCFVHCATLDLGAAAGALLCDFFWQHEVLLFTTFGSMVLFFMHDGSIKKRADLIFLWK